MPTILRNLKITKVDLVDRGAAIGARVTLFKRQEPQTTQVSKTEGAQMTLQEVLAALPEEQRKVVEAAMAELAAKSAEQAKSDEPKKDEEKPEEAMKRLPEALRKQLEADREAAQIAKKQADEARAEIAKMREEQRDRELLAKAAKYPRGAVAMSSADVVAVMKSLPDELAKKFEAHLAANEEAIVKGGLFKEIGSAFDGGESSPHAQLEAIAKRERDKDPSLTPAAAVVKAYELRPELYAAING